MLGERALVRRGRGNGGSRRHGTRAERFRGSEAQRSAGDWGARGVRRRACNMQCTCQGQGSAREVRAGTQEARRQKADGPDWLRSAALRLHVGDGRARDERVWCMKLRRAEGCAAAALAWGQGSVPRDSH